MCVLQIPLIYNYAEAPCDGGEKHADFPCFPCKYSLENQWQLSWTGMLKHQKTRRISMLDHQTCQRIFFVQIPGEA